MNTLRKIELKDDKYLHAHDDIENHNTLNKNERSRRVEEEEPNDEKYEEKNKKNYEKDTIKVIQDN